MVTTDKLLTIEDYRNEAPKYLSKMALDYYESGADEERTLKRNEQAYNRLLIRPHCLRDVSNVNTSVEWFGKSHPFPIGIAPSAFQKMAHRSGEVGTVTGASRTRSVMISSSWATTPMEEVAMNKGNATVWFQLYVYKDRATTEALIRRAEAAGYEALVLTVDTPVLGKRVADTRNAFTLPEPLKFANFEESSTSKVKMPKVQIGDSGLMAYVSSQVDPSLNWETLEWLVSFSKLPVIVKGVIRGDDAMMALEKGAKGIIVSNHGGRQMDSAPATIEALPEVVRAVNGRIPVFVDGGIRDGRDVFKAIALGAAGVFVGRPILWGLAVNGAAGVEEILNILGSEFLHAMKLSGCRNITELQQSKDVVVHENFYSKL